LTEQFIKQDTSQEYGGFAPFIGEYRVAQPSKTSKGMAQRAPTGAEAYSELYKKLGSADKVAEYLRAQGIPGIKYLDAGSRNVAGGTRNFVVFPGEEKSMTILERNSKTR
jgi:hypothetical protein